MVMKSLFKGLNLLFISYIDGTLKLLVPGIVLIKISEGLACDW